MIAMMLIRRLTTATALAVSISAGKAGPCSHEIDRVQALVDVKLDAIAATGPMVRESGAAMRHVQPTPNSMETAELQAGDLSASMAAGIRSGMARAREADASGDQAACEQALAEVQQAIGR
jgi:hypothetical protein